MHSLATCSHVHVLRAQWNDGAESTWETEDHISEEVMREYLDRIQQAKKKRSGAPALAGAAAAGAR